MQKGSTLIELIIYIALIGIIFGALSSLVVSGNKATQNRTITDSIYASGVHSLRQIRNDIEASSSVSIPTKGGLGNTLNVSVGGTSVTYSVVAGSLVRVEDTTTSTSTQNGVEVNSFLLSSRADTSAPAVVSVELELSHPGLPNESFYFTDSISTYYE